MATRILIVEDEPILALNYASILEDTGCDVIGPVSTISKGIKIIEREHIDGAVLDIDLGGVPVEVPELPLRVEWLARVSTPTTGTVCVRRSGTVAALHAGEPGTPSPRWLGAWGNMPCIGQSASADALMAPPSNSTHGEPGSATGLQPGHVCFGCN